MNLQHRIDLLVQLGKYIRNNEEGWIDAKEKATRENAWFISEFIDSSAKAVADIYLDENSLRDIARKYQIPETTQAPKTIGIVMAGNIPMVGFHDWLCVFLTGHNSLIKFSSKDNVLLKHLLSKLYEWEITMQNMTGSAELLKNCNAYIATGSDNTARYFEYYFNKYPSLIRRNRTSVAVLEGNESDAELSALADDIHLYFGLGCRNVTKLYVPEGYDFIPLLGSMKKYNYFFDHNKYKNNYDYQLAIQLLNNQQYMTNGSIMLIEHPSLFSPISQLNFEYYRDKNALVSELHDNNSVQCIVGRDWISFGNAQRPGWEDYADGVNTMKFLQGLQ
ncbi:acyl-CoA reductase [Flavihumibacter solisilvae]|uniref:Acyl-CoA reductase n=1 Tax=Flavihumibacter solisilvae TaxID=1349421 RepID=A0A0C1L023_9BACT|nr:acyl-CoA reductase [Flavihumibacter solisilvae]